MGYEEKEYKSIKFGQKTDVKLFIMDQEKEDQRRNCRREKI